ncbi:MAG TPA: hypothetical protein VH661_01720 [Candidatus Dormibacteraeota bacterium]|nr:hypothetical protein [Candidatus Dormibacteraeota bacterium]
MPGRRDPWRWAATSLMAVSALAVALATVRAGGAGPGEVRTASSTVPLLMGHLAPPLPPPRDDAAMAFDSRRHEVVLFGGDAADNSSAPPLTDTWVLEGRRWSQRNPPSHPPAMSDELMVFDAPTKTCILAGLPSSGFVQGSVLGEPILQTWSWDGTTWARFSDLRFSGDENLQGIAVDPTTGHPLLLTAPNAGPPAMHTWTWDGHAWTLRHTDPFAGGVTRPSLATISRPAPAGRGPGVLAIFGTATGSQTWFWDGATWSEQAEGDTPPYTPLSATMAGDPSVGTVVLVGLQDAGTASSWTWDGRAWNEGTQAPNVDSFYGATSALTDSSSGHPILIGDQPNQLDLIWTWDGQRWTTAGGV